MSDENVGGWKLVSVEPSQFQIQSIQAQTGCDEATARLFWSKLLYWASEPPADLSAHGQPVVDDLDIAGAANLYQDMTGQALNPKVFVMAIATALEGATHEH